MNKYILIAIATGVLAIIGWPTRAEEAEIEVSQETPAKEITHQQDLWIGRLEWCESSGDNEAINKIDLDGTPSYYAFQFKPSTFKYYAIKYKILSDDLEDEDYFNWMGDYEKQRKVVEKMVNDPGIDWYQQFPDCTRRLGLPPKK